MEIDLLDLIPPNIYKKKGTKTDTYNFQLYRSGSEWRMCYQHDSDENKYIYLCEGFKGVGWWEGINGKSDQAPDNDTTFSNNLVHLSEQMIKCLLKNKHITENEITTIIKQIELNNKHNEKSLSDHIDKTKQPKS